MARGEATELFAQEREQGLSSLLGNLDQSVFGGPAYPSIEAKAAHLLYFVIKNHPFSDGNPAPSFGEYPPDFFDFIVIDECHRGGANDESNWWGILEYFSPAVQLGLTATPKRNGNVDTYAYFGEPVYVYSLKEGINDGYLTPFKVKQIATTLDDYVYTSDDQLIEEIGRASCRERV